MYFPCLINLVFPPKPLSVSLARSARRLILKSQKRPLFCITHVARKRDSAKSTAGPRQECFPSFSSLSPRSCCFSFCLFINARASAAYIYAVARTHVCVCVAAAFDLGMRACLCCRERRCRKMRPGGFR